MLLQPFRRLNKPLGRMNERQSDMASATNAICGFRNHPDGTTFKNAVTGIPGTAKALGDPSLYATTSPGEPQRQIQRFPSPSWFSLTDHDTSERQPAGLIVPV